MSEDTPHYCKYNGCEKLLVRRSNEKLMDFRKRVFCNKQCRGRNEIKVEETVRYCKYDGCRKLLVRKQSETSSCFRRRIFCDRSCMGRGKKRRTNPKCTRCGGDGPFPLNNRRPDGRGSWCRECCKEISKNWREANPEKHKAAMQKWSNENIEHVKEYHKNHYNKEERREYVVANASKLRAYERKRAYGLSLEDFETMLSKQHNSCAICCKVFENNSYHTRPHVDHCHCTKRVRGLLCSLCNKMLGFVLDQPTTLLELACYLERPIENFRNRTSIREPITDSEKMSDRHTIKKYGLTFGQIRTILVEQDGKCSTCGRVLDLGIPETSVCVDHNHMTKDIRGLLCGSCNHALGMARDSVVVLRAGAMYLNTIRGEHEMNLDHHSVECIDVY